MERTPGSVTEVRDSCMAWHYRDCDVGHGNWQAKQAMVSLVELAKRTKARTKAQEELKNAEEAGDAEAINKFSSRLVKVTRQHNEDAKTLLRLMGVPVVEAPGEAEAQCAALAMAGKVWATGTEDMDALTFATPQLLKRMTFSAGQNQPIQ